MTHRAGQPTRDTAVWARLLRSLALLAVFAIVAAACGGDDDDAADDPPAAADGEQAVDDEPPAEPDADADGDAEPTETPTEEEPTPEPEPEEEPTSEEEPAGEPIRIMTVASFENPAFGNDFSEQSDAVEAHAAVLNAEGGIDGRPVEVMVCNTQDDPAQFLGCVRQGIDAGVAAMVGFIGTDTADAFALLEEAGIPAIGVVAGDPPSLASPNSFPTNNGAIGQFFALPNAFVAAGVSRASVVVPDIGGAGVAQLQAVWGLGLGQNGIEDGGFIPVPGDVTDMAPVVATATADGTDGVASSLLGDTNARLLQALAQLAPDVTVAIPGGLIDPSILEAAGDAAEGAIVVSWYPPISEGDIPGIERFVTEMAAFNPDANLTDQALNFWLAAYVFGNAAKEVADAGGTVDGPAVLAALSAATDVDTLGLTPPIDFTTTFTGFPGLDRLFNPVSVFTVVQDGELQLLDPETVFVDPFATG